MEGNKLFCFSENDYLCGDFYVTAMFARDFEVL